MPVKKAKKEARVDDEAELGLDDKIDETDDDIGEGFGDDDKADSDEDETY